MAVGGVYLFFIADRVIKIVAHLKKQNDFRKFQQLSTNFSAPNSASIAIEGADQGMVQGVTAKLFYNSKSEQI